ncbi:hypothetical protein [Azospirillum agricola]|uniref:hypothetical protein n=1 Tax=Azospirillum agricola TaxID=1720247 RepID=UPI000A0F10F1|nr:hypothetical protein [Azospirillum agricola]SMH61578.1 hypothetical protein SAMN02982994_5920 [Azospirillum lipoferum]
MLFAPIEHWFGLPPSDDTPILGAFGLRAILEDRYGRQTLDILPNRKSFFPPDTALSPDFQAFLDNEVTAWLKTLCGQSWINPYGRELYTLEHPVNQRLRAMASAMGSQGYFYVGAYEMA